MKLGLKRKKIIHYLIILFFTLITLLLTGYRFGDGDQNSHLPFLLKTINPQLYPNNPFLDLRHYHYSFFWYLLVPFLKTGLIRLEILCFLLFLFSLFLHFLAFYELLFFFTRNRQLSYISLAVFILPAFSFSIIPTHDTYLVNRSFTLPFLLFAILAFLKNQYWRAFLLLGLAYNFHALSANFVLAMFVMALLLVRRKIDVWRLFSSLFLFFICASPVLFWKFSTSHLDLFLHRDWYFAIDKGVLGHMFHLFSFNPPTILLALLGFANTAGFLLALKSKAKEQKLTTSDIKLIGFFLAIYLILLVCFITAEFLPITIAIQLQLSRAGKFIPILSYPYFIAYLERCFKKGLFSQKDFGLLLATIGFSGSLMTALLILPLIFKKKRILAKLILGLNIFMLIGIVLMMVKLEQWLPGVYIYPRKTAWHDVQLWAKKNTAIDKNFITPLSEWGHFYSDFLVLSQRNTVVTLGQLFEIAFHPDYIQEWRERFESVAPGAIESFNGNFLDNKRMVDEIYQRRTTQDFRQAAKRYDVSYIIVKKPKTLDFELVYENDQFRVYKTGF